MSAPFLPLFTVGSPTMGGTSSPKNFRWRTGWPCSTAHVQSISLGSASRSVSWAFARTGFGDRAATGVEPGENTEGLVRTSRSTSVAMRSFSLLPRPGLGVRR